MRRITLTLAALTLSGSLLVGCSGDDEDAAPTVPGDTAGDTSTPSDAASTEGPSEEFCNALDDLQQSRDDAREDPGAVEDDLDTLAAEAPGDTASQWEQAKAGYQDYDEAIQQLIDDAPDVPGVDEEEFVRQNRGAVQELVDEFLTPADALTSDLQADGRTQCDDAS